MCGGGGEGVLRKLSYLDEELVKNNTVTVIEPRHEKIGFLHMRKQRRRSASR